MVEMNERRQDFEQLQRFTRQGEQSAFADVVQFYKTEMPNNGWQPSGEPTEMEGVAMLDYSKDNRKAQVMITFDQEKQKVSVIITASQQ